MKLIEKVRAKSSLKNRAKGILATIAVITSGVLAVGVVTNPVAIAVLTGVGLLNFMIARKSALTVGDVEKIATDVKEIKENLNKPK